MSSIYPSDGSGGSLDYSKNSQEQTMGGDPAAFYSNTGSFGSVEKTFIYSTNLDIEMKPFSCLEKNMLHKFALVTIQYWVY